MTAGRGSRSRHGRGVLTDFDVRTLDDVVQATRLATPATWPEQLYARYLDPAPVKAVLHNARGLASDGWPQMTQRVVTSAVRYRLGSSLAQA